MRIADIPDHKPTLEQITEMAYLLRMVPRGEPVTVQWYDILANQYNAAITVANQSAPASDIGERSAAIPEDLRARGLSVAVHNDYNLNGEPHTFWLFTDAAGMSYKGEGKTDSEALDQVRAALDASPTAPQPSRQDGLEEAAKLCDEMSEHYAAYKDTALLNGDVALSNAASGEPRAAEYLAGAIRALKDKSQQPFHDAILEQAVEAVKEAAVSDEIFVTNAIDAIRALQKRDQNPLLAATDKPSNTNVRATDTANADRYLWVRSVACMAPDQQEAIGDKTNIYLSCGFLEGRPTFEQFDAAIDAALHGQQADSPKAT